MGGSQSKKSKISVVGNTAFIADGDLNRLISIDIRDPTAFVIISNLSSSLIDVPVVLVTTDAIAYLLCNNSNALVIINITNPSNMTVMGYLIDSDIDNVKDAKLVGNNIYVSCSGSETIIVVDISDPTTPVKSGYISLAVANGIAISGTTFLGSNENDIHSLNIRGVTLNSSLIGTIKTNDINVSNSVKILGSLNSKDSLNISEGIMTETLTLKKNSTTMQNFSIGTVSINGYAGYITITDASLSSNTSSNDILVESNKVTSSNTVIMMTVVSWNGFSNGGIPVVSIVSRSEDRFTFRVRNIDSLDMDSSSLTLGFTLH